MMRFALKKPLAVGENVTEIVQLDPGSSGDDETQLSVSVKGAGIETEAITSPAPPVLVRVADSGEEVLPRATAPKLVTLGEMAPFGRLPEPLRDMVARVFGIPWLLSVKVS